MSRSNKIFRFVTFSDMLATGGQPTPEQVIQLKEDGYDAVIRFVVGEADIAFPDESIVANRQGMDYAEIPISFVAPTEEVYNQFCDVMDEFIDKKVFVHCVAGYCSASMAYLYEATQGMTAPDSLEARLHRAWYPNEKWQAFMNTVLELHGMVWQI